MTLRLSWQHCPQVMIRCGGTKAQFLGSELGQTLRCSLSSRVPCGVRVKLGRWLKSHPGLLLPRSCSSSSTPFLISPRSISLMNELHSSRWLRVYWEKLPWDIFLSLTRPWGNCDLYRAPPRRAPAPPQGGSYNQTKKTWFKFRIPVSP